MEAYDMSKSDPGFIEKLGNGPCSSLPSLAHVLAIVSAVLLIGTPVIYSLSVLRTHASLVAELQIEVYALRQRVDQLESLDATHINTNKDQDENLRKLLVDFSKGYPTSEEDKEKLNGNSDSSANFLEKLFRDLELGSGSDTQWEAELQHTEPGELGREMVEHDRLHVSEEEDDHLYPADHSEDTPIRHHIGKLLSNRKQDRDDVTWETINRELARERPRRQAENRESRNRNRDRKASKGSGKRNRGNRGSTGRREQESEQAQQLNDGERRQRSRCQCPEADPPPQPEAAYIHFVGNVSSLVDTHPERTHPLSPRMVNVSENLLSDWAYARWTPQRQIRKFEFNNGEVIVKEEGVYFVYSQVQFFDDDRYTGHVITINNQETFKCAESPPQRTRNLNTCYVGGLAYLHRDSRVAVRVAFPHRWVNMHHDSAYFGMYKVAS